MRENSRLGGWAAGTYPVCSAPLAPSPPSMEQLTARADRRRQRPSLWPKRPLPGGLVAPWSLCRTRSRMKAPLALSARPHTVTSWLDLTSCTAPEGIQCLGPLPGPRGPGVRDGPFLPLRRVPSSSLRPLHPESIPPCLGKKSSLQENPSLPPARTRLGTDAPHPDTPWRYSGGAVPESSVPLPSAQEGRCLKFCYENTAIS